MCVFISKGNSVKCDRTMTIGKMSILSLHSWVVIKVYIIIKIMSKIIAYMYLVFHCKDKFPGLRNADVKNS